MEEDKYFESVHFGERLKIVMNSYNDYRSKPIELSRFMNWKSHTQVQYRFKKDSFDFKEVLQICDFFIISVNEFLGIGPSNQPGELNEPSITYKKSNPLEGINVNDLHLEEKINITLKGVKELLERTSSLA